MGFSKQEYWSGLPCPPPEDLTQGSNPSSCGSCLTDSSLPLSHRRSPFLNRTCFNYYLIEFLWISTDDGWVIKPGPLCSLNLQRICKSEILLSEIILPDLSLFLCGFLGLNCHFLLFSSLDNRNSPDLKKALRWILLTKRTTLPRNVFLSSSQMSQRHFIPESQICEPKAMRPILG